MNYSGNQFFKQIAGSFATHTQKVSQSASVYSYVPWLNQVKMN